MSKILIVEDHLPILNNLKEYLELCDYTVISAKNGQEGLKNIKEEAPDLILSDIKMSGMNGYELLKRLKSKSRTACIPFVFITSSVQSKDIKKGVLSGANAYLIKPFSMEKLEVTIEQLL